MDDREKRVKFRQGGKSKGGQGRLTEEKRENGLASTLKKKGRETIRKSVRES